MKSEITQSVIDAIKNDFDRIDQAYKFDMQMYKVSKLDREFRPPAMPILWEHLIKKRKLLTEQELLKEAQKSNDYYISSVEGYEDDYVALCRCRQFVTGFLREVDCAIRLKESDPEGKLYKDIEADIGHGGIDFVYVNSKTNDEWHIAVKMPPKRWETVDARSQRLRKEAKAKSTVVQFYALPNKANRDGLSKVSQEDIDFVSGGSND